MSIDRIAVVGGGTMGNGIAHVAAQNGRFVRLLDESRDVLDAALAIALIWLGRRAAAVGKGEPI